MESDSGFAVLVCETEEMSDAPDTLEVSRLTSRMVESAVVRDGSCCCDCCDINDVNESLATGWADDKDGVVMEGLNDAGAVNDVWAALLTNGVDCSRKEPSWRDAFKVPRDAIDPCVSVGSS